MTTRENEKWAWWCHKELMHSLEAKGKVQKPDNKAKRLKVWKQGFARDGVYTSAYTHQQHAWSNSSRD
jgi:hypothetical protein